VCVACATSAQAYLLKLAVQVGQPGGGVLEEAEEVHQVHVRVVQQLRVNLHDVRPYQLAG
jgi:hypothetical protein